MNKTLSIMASAMAAATLMSCNHDSDNRYEQTYERQMVLAVSDPSGKTEYTVTPVSFRLDLYNTSNAGIIIKTFEKPDGTILTLPTCDGLTLGASSTSMDYTFTGGTQSLYTGFANDMPLTVSGTLSSLGWMVSNTSNSSMTMTFAGGNKLTGFGSDMGFFSNTTVSDSQNPTAEPFVTNDATTNNVRIVLSAKSNERKATVYMYQANFDKNMKKKIDFMFEGVDYDINTNAGAISFRIKEAIPYLLTNNIKGDPMPSYKITDFECTIFEGFTTPGLFRFVCSDRYELSAMLTESFPKTEEKN